MSKSDDIPTHPKGRYERREHLGTGAFKSVYKAYDKDEGLEVAWNQVRLAGIPQTQRKKIHAEIKILEQLKHPNIINIFDYWEDDDKYVVFITEMMTSGTIKDFLRQAKTIRLKIVKKWCRQILSGLEYLHSHDPPIIHRDLKCDNIFMNGSRGEVKIGDLGLSIVMKDKKFAVSVIGTPEFMAPELYDEKYDEKVDIYAFGMCLLEMVTGRYPYSECENAAQIYRKVTQGIKPNTLNIIHDEGLKKFISICLDYKPALRPSAKEMLAHSFLQENSEEDDKVFTVIHEDVDTEDDSATEDQVHSELPNGTEIPISSGAPVSGATNIEVSITAPPTVSFQNQKEHDTADAPSPTPSPTPQTQTQPPRRKHKKTKVGTTHHQRDENESLDSVTGDEMSNAVRSSDSNQSASPRFTDENSTSSDERGWVTQVVFLEEGSDHDKIQMKLYLRIGGVFKEIKFPFMLNIDTPENVANEMVSELGLNSSERVNITTMISNALIDASKSATIDSSILSNLVPQNHTETRDFSSLQVPAVAAAISPELPLNPSVVVSAEPTAAMPSAANDNVTQSVDEARNRVEAQKSSSEENIASSTPATIGPNQPPLPPPLSVEIVAKPAVDVELADNLGEGSGKASISSPEGATPDPTTAVKATTPDADTTTNAAAAVATSSQPSPPMNTDPSSSNDSGQQNQIQPPFMTAAATTTTPAETPATSMSTTTTTTTTTPQEDNASATLPASVTPESNAASTSHQQSQTQPLPSMDAAHANATIGADAEVLAISTRKHIPSNRIITSVMDTDSIISSPPRSNASSPHPGTTSAYESSAVSVGSSLTSSPASSPPGTPVRDSAPSIIAKQASVPQQQQQQQQQQQPPPSSSPVQQHSSATKATQATDQKAQQPTQQRQPQSQTQSQTQTQSQSQTQSQPQQQAQQQQARVGSPTQKSQQPQPSTQPPSKLLPPSQVAGATRPPLSQGGTDSDGLLTGQQLSIQKRHVRKPSSQRHRTASINKILSPDNSAGEEDDEEEIDNFDQLAKFVNDVGTEEIKQVWAQLMDRHQRELRALRDKHRFERMEFARRANPNAQGGLMMPSVVSAPVLPTAATTTVASTTTTTTLPQQQQQQQQISRSTSLPTNMPTVAAQQNGQQSQQRRSTAFQAPLPQPTYNIKTNGFSSTPTNTTPSGPSTSTQPPQVMSLVTEMELKIMNEMCKTQSTTTTPPSTASTPTVSSGGSATSQPMSARNVMQNQAQGPSSFRAAPTPRPTTSSMPVMTSVAQGGGPNPFASMQSIPVVVPSGTNPFERDDLWEGAPVPVGAQDVGAYFIQTQPPPFNSSQPPPSNFLPPHYFNNTSNSAVAPSSDFDEFGVYFSAQPSSSSAPPLQSTQQPQPQSQQQPQSQSQPAAQPSNINAPTQTSSAAPPPKIGSPIINGPGDRSLDATARV